MPEFATTRKINAKDLAAKLDRIPDNHYLYFTGGDYGRRSQSGRSQCLNTVTEAEAGKLIKVRDYAERCANISGTNNGYLPDISVQGLYLHQGAKFATYLYLEKDKDGNYRAVRSTDYGFDPEIFGKNTNSFKKGAIVFKKNEVPNAAQLRKMRANGGEVAKVPAPTKPVTEPKAVVAAVKKAKPAKGKVAKKKPAKKAS